MSRGRGMLFRKEENQMSVKGKCWCEKTAVRCLVKTNIRRHSKQVNRMREEEYESPGRRRTATSGGHCRGVALVMVEGNTDQLS